MSHSLPECPTVASLRAEAGSRTEELAAHYGFPDWPTLVAHVEEIENRTWVYSVPTEPQPTADAIAALGCLNFADDRPSHRADAARLLADNPDASSIALAAATADVDTLRRDLTDPNAPTGPFGWPPLMYAAYSRLEVDADPAATTVTLLLDAGADPNFGLYFSGYPTPFTVLTGVFGGGEREQPPHPHAALLAVILLDAGADPNDAQTLYNRMFDPADDFLEVLFDHGLGRGDGGPWRARLPHLTPTPAAMVRNLLQWALIHDQRDRVALLASHDVDVVGSFADGDRPIDIAARSGHIELTRLLVDLGSPAANLNEADTFVAAALAGDGAAVRATPTATVERVRRERPGLIVWAAGQRKPDAIPLLIAVGFDIDAYARLDLPIEQPWETALHAAVERDDIETVRLLVGLGADSSLRDVRFDGTAADWAAHLGRSDIADELARSAVGVKWARLSALFRKE